MPEDRLHTDAVNTYRVQRDTIHCSAEGESGRGKRERSMGGVQFDDRACGRNPRCLFRRGVQSTAGRDTARELQTESRAGGARGSEREGEEEREGINNYLIIFSGCIYVSWPDDPEGEGV